MNSKYVYSVFHPEYLIDLLRAGGRFPIWHSFSLPLPESNQNEIKEFIDKNFPPLSEERHEIWVKFRFSDDSSSYYFSLEDIESAHFYSIHRQEAVSQGILHTLNVYGIPIGDPLDTITEHLIDVYSSVVRERTAATIIKAWFPEVSISEDFIDQLKMGYVHQQSPSPEKLTPIPSRKIWARLIAYNPGLRKFAERPDVLLLQDIQEVFRQTDTDFKQDLKSIGDKYSSKFSDLVDDAENSKKSGMKLLNWLLLNKNKGDTYLFELDQFLSSLTKQKSFFYSALLYLYWREKILNADFTGRLFDNKVINYCLINKSENNLRKSEAESLFTIIYAGGPRVFQKALIEARMKILHLSEFDTNSLKLKKTTAKAESAPANSQIGRLFESTKKGIGKFFNNLLSGYQEEKKKEILKDIKGMSLTKSKILQGDFDYKQYEKLCTLFEVTVEQFNDQPNIIDSIIQKENADKGAGHVVEMNDVVQSEENSDFFEQDNRNDIVLNTEMKIEVNDVHFYLNPSNDSKNEIPTGLSEFSPSDLPISELNSKNKLGETTNIKKKKKKITSVSTVEQEINYPDSEIFKVEKNLDNDKKI